MPVARLEFDDLEDFVTTDESGPAGWANVQHVFSDRQGGRIWYVVAWDAPA